MLKQVRCHQQKDGDGERADDAGQLGTGAGGFGNGSTR